LLSSSSSSKSSLPAFHTRVFRDLASADSSVRRAVAEMRAVGLIEVQRAYEKFEGEEKGVKEEGGQFNWKQRRMMGWRTALPL